MMRELKYRHSNRVLVAVDCIVFGYDGEHLKILLVKRAIEPQKDQWSLMGGFIGKNENLQEAASRILHTLTGLKNVYLEQLETYGDPERDPLERTVSVAYFALIDINKYKTQISDLYHAEWFELRKAPSLIFDHNVMVHKAKNRLRYQAAFHPILFELLPPKFTIPQLQNLYEQVYGISMDNRNFIRKVNATGLLIKLDEKDRAGSKRGAYYYTLDVTKYKDKFRSFIHFIPYPEQLVH